MKQVAIFDWGADCEMFGMGESPANFQAAQETDARSGHGGEVCEYLQSLARLTESLNVDVFKKKDASKK